jgi:AraC-like DNA-binding protein
MPNPVVTTSPQRVITFEAEHWDGPFCRPHYGAEYVERTPRTPQRLEFETFNATATWILTLGGEASYRVRGRTFRLTAGTVLVFQSMDEGVIVHPKKGGVWHHLWLAVGGEPALAVVDHVVRHHGQVHHLPDAERCRRAARGLLRAARAKKLRAPQDWSVRTHGWLNAWWLDAAEGAAPILAPLKTRAGARRALLAAGTLKEMARKLGYSRSYLTRRLKGMWDGVPSAALLRVERLKEAARLLRTTGRSVGDIATQQGYSRAGSFIAAFKAEFGVTPLRYRHQRGAPDR